MNYRNYFYFFLITLLCFSCSKKEIEKSTINEVNLEAQMIEAYKEGLKELKSGDVLFAAKKFNEAEILFPQSEYAPKSALMAAYSYYTQNYYSDAIAELIRFLRVYPNHNDIVYAEYLLGLCYYEQIVDEKKDLQSITNAKKTFNSLITKYPNTEFATDAAFKIDLINETLAAKEMFIGRYYMERKKWISAINRFRVVVDDYDTTIYVEEAIHRLVEIYYTIGIETEAMKYANLLGYNYQSSEWYEKAFSIFNKDYKKTAIKKIKKENNSILEKFKSLFN
ncbi:outer membrane protein assembly factor BamD [Candidatus Pelagibacter bacterium nBUS_25]|uniref:outer membrane protein assembly factor BamD n=1 Tax=Candidatus Pelagibacter bacterium nBUS_25 TaxID=3374187 RepID=UPI003EBCF5FD